MTLHQDFDHADYLMSLLVTDSYEDTSITVSVRGESEIFQIQRYRSNKTLYIPCLRIVRNGKTERKGMIMDRFELLTWLSCLQGVTA